jgi:hypothetical protein
MSTPKLFPLSSTSKTKDKKLLPPDLYPSFKQAMKDSNLSKIGMIEVLEAKIRLPRRMPSWDSLIGFEAAEDRRLFLSPSPHALRTVTR